MFNTKYEEAVTLLVECSQRAIPFNIILASLLVTDLIYNRVPLTLCLSWFGAIVLLSSVRWIYCRQIIKNGVIEENKPRILNRFVFLTLLMGITWGVCYVICLPYLAPIQEFILLLVYGGMCAGAIASLSVSIPAYYAYIVPIFLPVIIYNYISMDINRIILATMFVLFITMLILSAKANNKLLDDNIRLSHEKDALILDLEVMSITDPLTGLYNRRFFETTLPKELNRAKRNKHFLNLVFIDIDNFKLINDNLGHPVGDKYLIQFGELLKAKFKRSNDIIFRLGGDEFAVIMVNKSISESESMCNSLNHDFKERLLPNVDQREQLILEQVTLSMGIVNLHLQSALDLDNVIKVVDEALYQAKHQGKNQIVVNTLH